MTNFTEELNAKREGFKNTAPEAVQQVMGDAMAELKSANLVNNALKAGDTFPKFTLKDIEGNEINDGIFKEQSFTIMNFFRGGWCPYCSLELNALQARLNEITSLDAKLISIAPQTKEQSEITAQSNELKFPILVDSNNALARECGLVYHLADSVYAIYEKMGIDLSAINGDASHELPMPASYIVDSEGVICFAFVDEDYTLRIDPATLIGELKKLTVEA